MLFVVSCVCLYRRGKMTITIDGNLMIISTKRGTKTVEMNEKERAFFAQIEYEALKDLRKVDEFQRSKRSKHLLCDVH